LKDDIKNIIPIIVANTSFNYHAQKIERLVPQLNITRQFTIDFRLDSNIELYKFIVSWFVAQSFKISDTAIKESLINVADKTLNIDFNTLNDGNLNIFKDNIDPIGGVSFIVETLNTPVKRTWVYKKLLVNNIPNLQLAEGPTPMKLTTSFTFLDYEYPSES
jgi:hypothetical protein